MQGLDARVRNWFYPTVLRASHAIMTKKTKAQSTALAKAARESLEELSSSEDEGKPTQRGAPVTGATVSPSSSSSSASATVTAAASTSNPDRSRRAATQPKAAPLPKKLATAPKATSPKGKAAKKGRQLPPARIHPRLRFGLAKLRCVWLVCSR